MPQNPLRWGPKVYLTARLVRKLRRAKASEDGTVAKGRLRDKAQLSGPTGGCAVFQFCPVGMKTRSATLRSKGGEVLDLQASGFLHIMIIGDDIGILLGVASWSGY